MDNNNQKMPMVKRYPRQIWAAPRDGKTISCSESLCAPPENDTGKSPLEMHNSYSVFRIAIAQTGIGSLVANIPALDIPFILEEYRFQRDMLHRAQMQYQKQITAVPQGDAYTVPINESSCQKRTAADVLKDSDGVQKLEKARVFLEKNITKFPKNRQMISAIDEALNLYRSGGLLKAPSTYIAPPLYERQCKHKTTRHKTQRNFNLIYGIKIVGNANSKVEWAFEINNCYAPLNGTIPQMNAAIEKNKCSVSITLEEMDLLIYRLKATMKHFEALMFHNQYSVAQKYAMEQSNNR